jgi:GAF domain-containing protein/biotin carboxyl carrier protein
MSELERIETLKRKLEEAYRQLSMSASRHMVVHRAGEIMSATHDRREIGRELLDVIVDAVFSGSGCMAVAREGDLEILATHGLDADQEERLETSSVEGTLWELTSSREETLSVEDPDSDPDLAELVRSVEEEGEAFQPIFSLYVPLLLEGEFLGILSVGPRVTGERFAEEDLRFLETLASHAAVALHHCLLFEEKEQRIEQLSVLLRISKEITSTLDLDRVLTTIVNLIDSVIPNDRCVVALQRGTKLEMRAVSGVSSVDRRDREAYPVLEVLEWIGYGGRSVNVSSDQVPEAPEASGASEEPEGENGGQVPEVLAEYLSGGEFNALLGVLLQDEQGRMGVLALERRSAQPFSDEEQELAEILANQTSVAIRNAELYRRIPRVGVLEPLLSRTGGPGAWWRKKGVRTILALLPVVALYLFLPLPARVSGEAQVVPLERVTLRAQSEGIVKEVFFDEGSRVRGGTLIARLENPLIETALETSRSDLAAAEREIERARVDQDAFAFRVASMEVSKLEQEVRFREEEVSRLEIASPIEGLVLTPDLEERVGDYLEQGDGLVEIADLESMRLEVEVYEGDVGTIEPGQKVTFKTYAYPGRSFHGRVRHVGYLSDEDELGVRYRVVAVLDNPDLELRPGMTGRARVHVGYRPPRWIVARGFERGLRLKFWF